MASASVVLVKAEEELWEKIRIEVNENLNTRDQDLAAIKEWLRKQPHLPNEWEDRCLLTFLRGCKFSLEKCKRKLDMYFTMRTACPEFFTNRDIRDPQLMDLATKAQGPTMPGLTSDGRRVTIFRGVDKSLDPSNLNDVLKLALMIGDIRLMEETGMTGDVYILDASILAPSHLGKISPSTIKKFFICVQEALPLRMKEAHVVNTTPLVHTLFNIVKPFLKEKLRKRVYFHGDLNSLHKHVPKNMLPTEYGGTGGSLADINKAWVEKLEVYRDWFKKQDSLKANESLRPGKPTNYEELFGMDGSFRQLSID